MKLVHFLPGGLLLINLFAKTVALSLSAERRNCKEKGVLSKGAESWSGLRVEQPLEKPLDTLMDDRKCPL